MPSVISHPAAPLSLALAYGRGTESHRLTIAAVLASLVPDLDYIGWRFGISLQHTLGHRAFSHSLTFAVLLAATAALSHRHLRTSASTAFIVVLISTVSHGILDALTSGGLGIAFFSPFSNRRYFFPWRPITVSPLSITRFFSPWGVQVVSSEVLWVWLPCVGLGLLAAAIRRRARVRFSSHTGSVP
jgi:inner membrane protein